MTFDNIGWLVYLFTRVEPVLAFASAILIGVCVVFGAALIASLICCMEKVNYPWQFVEKYFRRFVLTIILSSLVLLIVPNKEDTLLIAGVVLGAQVTEKVIAEVSESEMTGKVIDIVSAKLDQKLDEMLDINKPQEVKPNEQ